MIVCYAVLYERAYVTCGSSLPALFHIAVGDLCYGQFSTQAPKPPWLLVSEIPLILYFIFCLRAAKSWIGLWLEAFRSACPEYDGFPLLSTVMIHQPAGSQIRENIPHRSTLLPPRVNSWYATVHTPSQVVEATAADGSVSNRPSNKIYPPLQQ